MSALSNGNVVSFKDYKAGLTPLELREAEAMFAMTPAERDADLVKFRERQAALHGKAQTDRQEMWDELKIEAARLANERIRQAFTERAIAKPATDDSWPQEENLNKFAIIEAADFAGADIAEPEWIVDDLIVARGIGLAWGLSGSHKTGGIFDLMACVHRGIDWRGKSVKQGRCVMVVGEGEYMFPLRMRAYAKHHNINVGELPAVVPSPINLRDGKEVAAFAHELLKLGCSQVWFDTLQQCSPGADENSVRDMGEVISNLKFIARKVGCFAGVLHHAGKCIDKGARGSSAWRPAVDVELYFESDGMAGTMKVEKLKDAAPYSVYAFKREIVPLGFKKNGEPRSGVLVVQTEAAPKPRGAKLPTANTAKRKAYDAIAALSGATVGHQVEWEAAWAAAKAALPAAAPGEKDGTGGQATVHMQKLILESLLFRTGDMLRLTEGQATAGDWE